MARKRKDSKLSSRSARIQLTQRDEPYWRTISKGLALGYRKGAHGGTWIAKYNAGLGRRKESLAVADDYADPDGVRVLSFDQAQEAARSWAKRKAEEDAGQVIAGSYTIGQAMDDYITDRERVRRKRLDRTRSVIEAHIRPKLGQIELSKLTHGKVKAWRDALAEASPRIRNKPDATQQSYREIDTNDPDAVRKRQATANRILTVLKAALNHAYRDNRVASKAAWEKISPFREVDVPKVRYLTVKECKRLIDACPADFCALVRAALYTGCRYGELTAMRMAAFNKHAKTIQVERSKSGKGRYIPLTNEGAAFFQSVTDEKTDTATMFTHASGRQAGEPWEHSQQRHWMERACETAKIEPSIGFHILRHTYASQLAMNGTPMPVIASLLGHADTRMTEKHYGHLSPSYVADTLRANLPSFGFTRAEQSEKMSKMVAREDQWS